MTTKSFRHKGGHNNNRIFHLGYERYVDKRFHAILHVLGAIDHGAPVITAGRHLRVTLIANWEFTGYIRFAYGWARIPHFARFYNNLVPSKTRYGWNIIYENRRSNCDSDGNFASCRLRRD
jgi:hypothetical protein